MGFGELLCALRLDTPGTKLLRPRVMPSDMTGFGGEGGACLELAMWSLCTGAATEMGGGMLEMGGDMFELEGATLELEGGGGGEKASCEDVFGGTGGGGGCLRDCAVGTGDGCWTSRRLAPFGERGVTALGWDGVCELCCELWDKSKSSLLTWKERAPIGERGALLVLSGEGWEGGEFSLLMARGELVL